MNRQASVLSLQAHLNQSTDSVEGQNYEKLEDFLEELVFFRCYNEMLEGSWRRSTEELAEGRKPNLAEIFKQKVKEKRPPREEECAQLWAEFEANLSRKAAKLFERLQPLYNGLHLGVGYSHQVQRKSGREGWPRRGAIKPQGYWTDD